MKVLLSNDDGIQASGINFLNDELSKGHQTTVIAPHKERSSCGHGISLGEPLRVNKIRDNYYECSGFPADCVLIGVGQMMKNELPDLVISGINHGANLGQDRYYSGTMAAAREAAFRGIPSIAVSLVTIGIRDVEHFDVAAKFIAKIVDRNIQKYIPPMCLLNVNVPNIPEEKIAGVKVCFAGFQQYSEEVVEREDTRGRKYYWVGGTYIGPKQIPGSDCDAVFNNYISLDLQSFNPLEKVDNSSIHEFVKLLE